MIHMLHIAAATQARLDTEGRRYYRRKLAAGKTRMEAMRCLKRRISDAVYRQLIADAEGTAIAAEKEQAVQTAAGAGTGPGRALRGPSCIRRGRPSPAHRHFGSATSRASERDATTSQATSEDHGQTTSNTAG